MMKSNLEIERVATLYQSMVNIVRGKRSNLYWGIDKITNEIVDISEVESNGLACNCRCAVCGGDFVACIGDVNRSHFRHKSVYNCLFANEVAMYMFAKSVLEENKSIKLPDVIGSCGFHCERIKEACHAEVGKVIYTCNEKQYPPLLIAECNNRPVRIILEFGRYYTSEDLQWIKKESTEKDWDCLLIKLPAYDQKKAITLNLVKLAVQGCVIDKIWIRNALEEHWQRELQERLVNPPQRSEEEKMILFSEEKCPNCTSPLRHIDGSYGEYWICSISRCNFSAHINPKTGELVFGNDGN